MHTLDELLKLAALTDEEKELLQKAVRQHAAYDAKSGAGKLSGEEQEAMRHNVERIKHFRSKSKDDSHQIPSWAKSPTGKPPSSGGQAHWASPPGPGSYGAAEEARAAEWRRTRERHQQRQAEEARSAGRAYTPPPPGQHHTEAGGARARSPWDDFRDRRESPWDDFQEQVRKSHEEQRNVTNKARAAAKAATGRAKARAASRKASEAAEHAAASKSRRLVGGLATAAAVAGGAYLAHRAAKMDAQHRKDAERKRKERATQQGMPKAAELAGSMLDELEKLGVISDEQARKSLERLDTLEKSKPTGGQVARYATIGGIAVPAIKALGQTIKGGRGEGVSALGHLAGAKTPGHGAALRQLAGSVAEGALSAGAVPLIRARSDRSAEIGKLKSYLAQEQRPVEG